MFKNALLYRITEWTPPSQAEIEGRLDTSRFAECGATQLESVGWVEPRGEKNGALIENVGGQLILRLCIERKAVPSSVVKTQLNAQLDKIEVDTGRRPKGKKAKEIKEEIVQDLLPRAFPKRGSTLVWLNPKTNVLLIDAASTKKADVILTRLVELLGGGIKLTLIQTETSAAVAMAHWLKEKDAPAGFSIDRECELKQPDSEKSTVRYARHTLDIDEVAAHIEQGKLPTQLAMTWEGRVSFVLTEAGAVKKIKLLDGVMEGAANKAGKDDNGFDADVAISTGELGKMIPDLVASLGGELDREAQLAKAAAVTAVREVAAA
jgi:recombination associated protein RdgC